MFCKLTGYGKSFVSACATYLCKWHCLLLHECLLYACMYKVFGYQDAKPVQLEAVLAILRKMFCKLTYGVGEVFCLLGCLCDLSLQLTLPSTPRACCMLLIGARPHEIMKFQHSRETQLAARFARPSLRAWHHRARPHMRGQERGSSKLDYLWSTRVSCNTCLIQYKI